MERKKASISQYSWWILHCESESPYSRLYQRSKRWCFLIFSLVYIIIRNNRSTYNFIYFYSHFSFILDEEFAPAGEEKGELGEYRRKLNHFLHSSISYSPEKLLVQLRHDCKFFSHFFLLLVHFLNIYDISWIFKFFSSFWRASNFTWSSQKTWTSSCYIYKSIKRL